MSPEDLDAAALGERPLPALDQNGGKEERGRVLVVGGSVSVPGAALLAAEAALRVGAGKVQLAVPASVASGLGWIMPEARVFALAETPSGEIDAAALGSLRRPVADAHAVVAGPGIIDDAAGAAISLHLQRQRPGGPMVLDAGAMTRLEDPCPGAVLTPHGGEMAALMGAERSDVEADPLGFARRTAERLGCVVVMKGKDSFVVSPQGEAFCHRDGPVGLATAGSGDVLAGLIGGALARGAAPFDAALWGVYLHGEAGRRLSHRVGPVGFLAREIAAEVPGLLAAF